MMLYILTALWPLIIMYVYTKNTRDIQKSPSLGYLILAAFPMFAMIALRGDMMGADTSTYARHFSESIGIPLSQMIELSRMENGYLVFVKILTYFTHSPKLYQVIYSTIYMIGFVSFAKQLKGTDSFLFFYFVCTLGLFMFMFTGVRQCLAISVCLYAFQYLVRKRYVRFVLLILLAFTLHQSALLCFIMLLVWNRDLRWYGYLIYVLLIYLLYENLSGVQVWLNDKFDYDYEIENASGGLFYLIFLLCFTIYAYFVKRRNNTEIYMNTLFNMSVLTVVFWILRLQTRVAERPSFYFIPFTCALFACTVNRSYKLRYEGVFRYAILVVSFLLYVYRLRTNFSTLIPYSSFL